MEDNIAEITEKVAEVSWLKHYKEHGWVVIPGVISPEKASRYYGRIWQWIMENFPEVNKHKIPTWCSPTWALGKEGYIEHYGASHAGFMWEARCEPGVAKVFKEVYLGEERFLTSFEGFRFQRPQEYVNDDKFTSDFAEFTPKGGKKIDPAQTEHAQGYLALSKHDEANGSWLVQDASHLPKRGNLPYAQVILEANPGDFILFNSRLKRKGVNAPAKPKRIRPGFLAGLHITFVPTSWINAKTIRKKQDAFFSVLPTDSLAHFANTAPALPAPFVGKGLDGKPTRVVAKLAKRELTQEVLEANPLILKLAGVNDFGSIPS